MIRTFGWFLYFGSYLLAVEPIRFKVERLAKQGKTEEHDKIVHTIAPKWARSLIKAAGVKVEVVGKENIPSEGSVLFVSNHQGNFDIPLLLGFVDKPIGFVAKMELAKLPSISTWMKHLNCVFMDRSDVRQSLKAINQAADYLKQGYSMVIFPEGTRSRGNSMGEFKPGSLKLATKASVPIVPITINGSYKIMEENKFKIKPAKVKIIIHEPIPTKGLSKEQQAELSTKVREIIKQAL